MGDAPPGKDPHQLLRSDVVDAGIRPRVHGRPSRVDAPIDKLVKIAELSPMPNPGFALKIDDRGTARAPAEQAGTA
jgi:hypothetical protein